MLSNKYTGLFSGLLLFLVVLFLPAPGGMSPEAKKAAAVVILMTIWWISDAIPIYATAFLPMALFPVLGILPASETALSYGHNYVLMTLAGFFLAKAIETQNLHKRIALVLIKALGTDRRKLVLSIMMATAFLSMWIANVTATLLMLPIALAIISKEEAESGSNKSFSKAMLFGIAYAASIGGVATLVGSPTNLIFIGIFENLFPDAPPITFLTWLKIGLPLAIVFLPITWLYLTANFKIKGSLSESRSLIDDEMRSLGKMSKGEKNVLAVFVLTVFGWVFREDMSFGSFVLPGWSSLMGLQDFVHDSTVAMISALMLFILPAEKDKRVMSWKSASQIPWGVAMIIGGGYAIAAGFKATGLATWLGGQLAFISGLPFLIVLILIVGFILLFTELNSNTATANIFLPVLASVAVAGSSNPLLLMIPATMACSFAFMMPAGTGPNTVIFGSERVTTLEMVKCGSWMKLISLVVLTLTLYFITMPLLHLETGLPAWAK